MALCTAIRKAGKAITEVEEETNFNRIQSILNQTLCCRAGGGLRAHDSFVHHGTHNKALYGNPSPGWPHKAIQFFRTSEFLDIKPDINPEFILGVKSKCV